MQLLTFFALMVSLALSLSLLGLTLVRREHGATTYYIVLCAAISLYLCGCVLQTVSTDLSSATLALAVQDGGLTLLPPYLLLFLLSVQDERLLRPWMGPAGAAYAFLFWAVGVTNQYHSLLYRSIQLAERAGMPYLVLRYGPLFYLRQVFGFAFACMGMIALLRKFPRWTAKARYRYRHVFLCAALVAAARLLTLCDIPFARALPLTPLSLTVAVTVGTACLIRRGAFDILPAASQTIVENMDSAIVVLDTDWCFESCNPAALQLFPGLGRLLCTEPVCSVEGWPELLAANPGAGRQSFELPDEDGQPRRYQAVVREVADRGRLLGWSLVIRDTTETSRLMEKLQAMARTDFLTGIHNRRHFLETAGRELALARREGLPTSLVMLDLDHFKQINDTFGHHAGDEVLVLLANTIKTELRSYDIFARYGGEEFIIFSVGMLQENAESFAERLRASLRRISLDCRDTAIRVTASFGVVEIPPDCTLQEAIAAADRAMYMAKRRGRNQVAVGRVTQTASITAH